MYQATEDSIIQRLSSLSPAIIVEPLPDNEAGYDKPYTKPRANLMLLTEKFEASNSMGAITQPTTLTWLFVIESKTLRGDGGIYDVVAKLKKKLLGFQPTHGTKMYGAELVFVDRDEKTRLFTYNLTMAHKAMAVEDETDLEPELGANISRIQHDEPGNPAVIVVTDNLQTQDNENILSEDSEELHTNP